MTDQTNNGDLLSITTMHEAAAALKSFKPVHLDLGLETGKVAVNKLPAGEFAEGLARFSGQLAPLVNEARKLSGKGKQPAVLTDELIAGLGKDCPEAVIWLALHGTSLDEEQVRALAWDAVTLLAVTTVLVNFVHNAALRVFTHGVGAAAASVAAEHATAALEDSANGASR